ncbi:response regulator [Caulobacter sp. 17J80-11]|uniref:response regulator n=1 Tax=Caulobacter sp. 17J80-11 TaxID=2763502 RepID=UPI001653D960|nr:response regulator [Caulobacter sp. 17J80-11]MBC6981474.1 response regulator [Caulobacter sp. 17J80-11]
MSEEAAAERLKAREDFLRLMSHEIRTPLNGVIGMLGLLARTKMDGAQRAYLSGARESADHLLSLVNDLLDFARIEAGRLELEAAPVDVERLVQSVAELLSPRAHEKGLELAWAVDADVPDVLADDGRLRQILFNLAGNAVKYTETGGALISVRRAGGRGKKAKLRFSVRDTGPGVPEAARERVFEEYGHAQPQHACRYDSAGLGLAVVKRLVEAMEGAVGVSAAAGGGSEFWFEASFPTVAAEPRETPLEGLTVAIASPSALVREAAGRQVEAAGGTIAAAASMEAVTAAPDAVVLVDHALAVEAGTLVPRPRDRKAIVLLRPEQRELIEKYRGAGYCGYLIKPLRRSSLAVRVKAALSGQVSSAGGLAPLDDDRVAPATIAGVRVLLAEDNPVNALLVQTVLRREGCTVELAGTGGEVLDAMTRARFDLVLMDVRMPGMDGMAATRALRARGEAAPIVALTANAFDADRKACIEAGMNDFLTKPIDPATLRHALARWTNRDMRVKLAS